MSNLITMRELGLAGRWGNQVFQYAFLRTYARRHGLAYQTGQWIGQALMGHADPPIVEELPAFVERRDARFLCDSQDAIIETLPHMGPSYPPEGDEVRGHDMRGYCQFHTSYYAPDKEFIRGLFVPTESIRRRMEPAADRLRGRGKRTIGLHLRRGDTGRFIYYLTPNQWYLRWLEEHWQDGDTLFVASEEPGDRAAFAKYNPVMSSDLLELSDDPYDFYNYLSYDLRNPTPIAMDWFPDWYLLNQCDVLVFGNSTFSYTAAMFNPNLQSAWRSMLSTQRFAAIDPWNDWPLVREDIRNYPGVADTWYDRNPKWEP